MTRSERAREREVHRYYQTWLESSRGYLSPKNISRDDPLRYDANAPRHEATQRISRDKALVAFAQLGCLRLNVRRAIVTLIDFSTSFILAEATRTISLLSGGQHAEGDELWFGTASIPRSQGISEAALDPLLYTASSPDGQSHAGPALVMKDMTLDSRFSGREYVGNGATFYAGVPIVSKNGFTIGVYELTDDKPRHGLTVQELQFMQSTSTLRTPISIFPAGEVTGGGPDSRCTCLNTDISSQKLTKSLQDIASTVSDHLENIRNDTARHRGERMVLGLGAFTEGQTSMDTEGESTSARETSSETSRNSFHRTTFKGFTIADTDPSALRNTMAREELSSSDEAQPDDIEPSPAEHPRQAQGTLDIKSNDHANSRGVVSESTATSPAVSKGRKSKAITTDAELGGSLNALASANQSSLPIEFRQTFARAANILRQCTNSDGVMFFDAESANVGNGYKATPTAHQSDGNDASTSPEDAISSSGGSSDDLAEQETGYFNHPSPQNETYSRDSRQLSRTKKCEMLGYSFRLSSVAKINNSKSGLVLRESEMRRFIRRYPKGLVMHFTKDGGVSSSDESSARDRAANEALARSAMTPNQREKKRVIAKELIKVVPGARNVIWLPLWDFAKARWSAGCFVWSSRPERLLNAQEDLVYMKAFANTLMGEINRLGAIASDQAKSNFIANISHELRSPLHGILGSIEFLQDTAVDPFQAAMITTVETCGKTLLDTVNHVLDFAKLSKRSSRGSQRPFGKAALSAAQSDLEKDFDIAIVVEEVVEAIYSGQTFRSTGAFHDNEDEHPMSPALENPVSKRLPLERTSSKFSGAVRLILDVERLDSWFVRTQPGAIRRIVMNIFGNALKYTDHGSVCVSLQSTKGSSRKQNDLSFCISVADTGKGMSLDFARNHAWEAFSQEDSFAHGVGLGLSIVQHITSSLGGKVDLKSSKGHGTDLKILLTVPLSLAPPGDSQDVIKVVAQRVKGLKLCLLDSGHESSIGADADLNKRTEDAFRRLASSWFGMKVLKAATVREIEADFFIYIEPPPADHLLKQHGVDAENTNVPLIVVSPNAFESAALRKETQRLKDLGRTIDFISQPCGPQKLARAFERCLYRGPFTAPPDLASPSPAGCGDLAMKTGPSSRLEDTPVFSNLPLRMSELSQQECAQFQPAMSDASSDTPTETRSESAAGSNVSKENINPHVLSVSSEDQSTGLPESLGKDPVLLVDDNEVNLKLLVAFVRKARYPYETAKDGLQALELYKEASKDLKRAFKAVVIDIQMPVMDGITATREIRSYESKNRIEFPATIIALTGLASSVTRRECAKAGVDHFLPKPVKFKEFLKLLER